MLVPADRYVGRADEVLALSGRADEVLAFSEADEVLAFSEAGRSPDGLGEPIPPAERDPDLFRITSHRGQIELPRLGQRIALPLRG